jgi:predicted dehydrogenase
MRWAFLGIGRVTHRMVQAVRAAGHEVRVGAGRDPDKLAQWLSQFSVPNGTTNFQEAIERSDIDAVYIAVPPALHLDLTQSALKLGKRVLCEKALTQFPSEASELLETAKHTGTVVVDATAFPHHPRSLRMREIIDSGELGELCRITVACSVGNILDRKDHRSDAHVGGGCLLDLGWYCVYSTAWLTGFEADTMHSEGTRISHAPESAWYQVQTMARLKQTNLAALQSRNCTPHRSLLASWDCGYEANGRKWIEISGTKASLICDDFLRPWDIDKPRFWVHGHDGKARAELVGEGVFQEVNLVQHVAHVDLQQSLKDLEIAVMVQKTLGRIEADLQATQHPFV